MQFKTLYMVSKIISLVRNIHSNVKRQLETALINICEKWLVSTMTGSSDDYRGEDDATTCNLS